MDVKLARTELKGSFWVNLVAKVAVFRTQWGVIIMGGFWVFFKVEKYFGSF